MKSCWNKRYYLSQLIIPKTIQTNGSHKKRQDTLIDMFRHEIQKIKEEKVNEMTIIHNSKTLNHLGGKRFMVMTILNH